MHWVVTKNNRVINIKDIPSLSIDDFRNQIIKQCDNDKRVVSFFGVPEDKKIKLYVVLADDEDSQLLVSSTLIDRDTPYTAITQDVPAFHIFERELYEEFGIAPHNHPWLKPVRYAFDRYDAKQKMENYPFFTMKGEEVHEVAVGPIHAGVIEPGHFRFMCNGEDVYHLEIQLGYQHRGVEKLFLKNKSTFNNCLAESIAGDTVIGHTVAYANAMEALGGVEISHRAMTIRAIALELERAAVHIGDLGAISNDVAYLMGSAVFGAIRTLVINTSLALCGSRFGRGLVRVGGVVFDIDNELNSKMKTTLKKVNDDVEQMSEMMFSVASVLSRLQNTGVVDKETARKIGLVGLAARASGVSIDVRADHPYGIFKNSPIYKMGLESGDVFARSYLRYVEIKQSLSFINEQLDNFPEEDELLKPVKQIVGDRFVVSMTEGWRGEIVHTVITGKDGELVKYKIKDPSFNNWYGLAFAVRNNGISDFPLCNKSFNLSYCGNDL